MSWRLHAGHYTTPPIYTARGVSQHQPGTECVFTSLPCSWTDELGHCTDHTDHVRLLDGGTLSAPVIGSYCGHVHDQLTVLSTGRDLMMTFSSDRHTLDWHNDTVYVRRGFHAVFTFQRDNDTTSSIDDAHLDTSRYVDVGGHSPDWTADLDYVDDTQDAELGHSVGAYQSMEGAPADSDRDSNLWPVLSLLIVVVVCAAVAFLLVVHHYRQKLSGAREEVIEEQQAQVLEDVPLRAVTITPRHTQPFKYRLHLPPPTLHTTLTLS